MERRYKTITYPRLCIGTTTRKCGKDIGDRHTTCKRCLECQIAKDKDRRKEERAAAVGVRSERTHVEPDPSRVSVKHCQICGGMPWARLPVRQLERCGSMPNNYSRFGEPVAMPAGLGVPGHHVPVCRGCGDAYSPEPGLQHAPYISSSAGMALRRF